MTSAQMQLWAWTAAPRLSENRKAQREELEDTEGDIRQAIEASERADRRAMEVVFRRVVTWGMSAAKVRHDASFQRERRSEMEDDQQKKMRKNYTSLCTIHYIGNLIYMDDYRSGRYFQIMTPEELREYQERQSTVL